MLLKFCDIGSIGDKVKSYTYRYKQLDYSEMKSEKSNAENFLLCFYESSKPLKVKIHVALFEFLEKDLIHSALLHST